MLKTATNFEPSNVLEVQQHSAEIYGGNVDYKLATVGNTGCVIFTRLNFSADGSTDQAYYPDVTTGNTVSVYRNGDEVHYYYLSFEKNKRYTIQNVYFQGNPDFIGDETEINVSSLGTEEDYSVDGNCLVKCDMKLCSGQIVKMDTSSDDYAGFYLPSGISGLRDAVYCGNKIVGCAELRFSASGFKAPIHKYNPKTGYVVIKKVSQVGSIGHTPDYSDLKAGDNFEIYTSYLIDEPHSVITRVAPKVTCKAERVKGALQLTASISSRDAGDKSVHYLIKDSSRRILADSGIMFEYDKDFTYTAYIPQNLNCKVTCDITTYDDCTYSAYSDDLSAVTSAGEAVSSLSISCDNKYCPKLSFTTEQTGQLVIYRNNKYIAKLDVKTGETNVIYDYLANNNTIATYQFEITNDTGVYVSFASETISWDGVILRELHCNGNHRYSAMRNYRRFITTDSTTDISNNLGITVAETDGQPVISRSDTDYQSGQLTADLLKIQNGHIIDDYDTVDTWITNVLKSTNPFILSLPKGDTMVIAVTGVPSRHYDNDTGLTQVTLDWVEVDNSAVVEQ